MVPCPDDLPNPGIAGMSVKRRIAETIPEAKSAAQQLEMRERRSLWSTGTDAPEDASA
jgi:hypothetical protein